MGFYVEKRWRSDQECFYELEDGFKSKSLPGKSFECIKGASSDVHGGGLQVTSSSSSSDVGISIDVSSISREIWLLYRSMAVGHEQGKFKYLRGRWKWHEWLGR